MCLGGAWGGGVWTGRQCVELRLYDALRLRKHQLSTAKSLTLTLTSPLALPPQIHSLVEGRQGRKWQGKEESIEQVLCCLDLESNSIHCDIRGLN